jgi:hypothetical protein
MVKKNSLNIMKSESGTISFIEDISAPNFTAGYPLAEKPTISVSNNIASLSAFASVFNVSEANRQFQALTPGTSTVIHDSGVVSAGTTYNFYGKSGIIEGNFYDFRGRQRDNKKNTYSEWSNVVNAKIELALIAWGDQTLTGTANGNGLIRSTVGLWTIPSGVTMIRQIRINSTSNPLYVALKIFSGDNVTRSSITYNIPTATGSFQTHAFSTAFAVSPGEICGFDFPGSILVRNPGTGTVTRSAISGSSSTQSNSEWQPSVTLYGSAT